MAFLQAAFDDPVRTVLDAGGDAVDLNQVVGVDDQHVAPLLVFLDRRLGDDQTVLRLGTAEQHVDELVRQQHAVRIGEFDPDLDQTGRRVDLAGHEIDPALLVEDAVVAEAEPDEDLGRIEFHLVLDGSLPHGDDVAIADGEQHIDRVERGDGGQHVAVRPDQVAQAVFGAPYPAGNGCGDLGIAELDFGERQVGLARLDAGFRLQRRRPRLVKRRLAHIAPGDENLGPGQRRFGLDQHRAGTGQIGFGKLHTGLERGGIDDEQDIALLDVPALGEAPLDQLSLNPRAQLYAVDGGDAAQDLERLDDLAPLDRLHDDGRRLGCAGLCGRFLLVTSGERQRQDDGAQRRRDAAQKAGLGHKHDGDHAPSGRPDSGC